MHWIWKDEHHIGCKSFERAVFRLLNNKQEEHDNSLMKRKKKEVNIPNFGWLDLSINLV